MDRCDDVRHFAPSDCVELLDVFGSDARVVNAARVSYAKWIDEEKPLAEGDQKLMGYLAKHQHISPFFHPQLCFRIKMPIFVAREWYRHTVGLSRNEVSRRYVDNAVECFVPTSVRARSATKKQGSADTPTANSAKSLEAMRFSMLNSVYVYRDLLAEGAAPEIARMVLPQSMMTEFIETGSLAAYARLCNLRLSSDAQLEIRAYAECISALIREKFPVAWAELVKV